MPNKDFQQLEGDIHNEKGKFKGMDLFALLYLTNKDLKQNCTLLSAAINVDKMSRERV